MAIPEFALRYLALLILGILFSNSAALAQKPNVLFVIVDDMRPELGCYGNDEIKTPSIDQFANSGTTFLKAYCQAAVKTSAGIKPTKKS